MSVLENRNLGLLLRLIVGGMFVYASLDKVADPRAFAIAVRAYQIVPVSVSGLFALVLAWSELIAGAMLILGVFTRYAAGAIAILLAMFVAALSLVLIKGMVIDCGCFSSEEGGSSPVSPLLIIRNLGSLFACWVIIRYPDGFLSAFAGPTREHAATS
jgi:putative oxidoreductase